MAQPSPRRTTAGEREAGVICRHCFRELALGDLAAICSACGAVHHDACWEEAGCRGYQCTSPSAASVAEGELLAISRDDLAAAQPLPAPTRQSAAEILAESRQRPKTWNRTAIAALVVALLGIPLFGLVTGLAAILLACIALAVHNHRRKGMAVAVAALVLGIVDVVGWTIGLAVYFNPGNATVALSEMVLDPEALDMLPDEMARALRANVLIQVNGGLGRQAMGSGVVLQITNGLAKIVTNRHVIDPSFTDRTKGAPQDLSDLAEVTVMSIAQGSAPGVVEWVAPHGIDLAIVSASLEDNDVREARWSKEARAQIGDQVFAVGNPHGLGWTHSEGSISQVRTRKRTAYKFKILQSTAAINPGSSGGGLYDVDGKLIGINTLTGDKRVAEGLGFAITFGTLLDLAPDWLDIPDDNAPALLAPEAEAEAEEENEAGAES